MITTKTRPAVGARGRTNAFTLLELVIVVVIVAVLVWMTTSKPYGHTPSPRAKAARVRSDMRTLSQAFAAYRVEYGSWPAAVPFRDPRVPEGFTTFGTGLKEGPELKDEFRNLLQPSFIDVFQDRQNDPPSYVPFGYATWAEGWVLYSRGPDRKYDLLDRGWISSGFGAGTPEGLNWITYDPTNGLESNGDILRVGGLE